MHLVTLNISDKSYDEFLAYLKNYNKKDIEIIEDRNTPEFIVSSLNMTKRV